MTKDGSFKKVVRRHAAETGQRCIEAKADLEGLEARMEHSPVAERLVAHLRERYRIDAVAATPISRHVNYVLRVDRNDGDPWVARAFPPARPRVGAEGDATILRHLDVNGYPAERLATADPVSEFEGSTVLVTEFCANQPLPPDQWGSIMGDLLGRLHALPLDESVGRPGGAEGGARAAKAVRGRTSLRPSRFSTPSTRRWRQRTATRSNSCVSGCARPTPARACPRRWCTATSWPAIPTTRS